MSNLKVISKPTKVAKKRVCGEARRSFLNLFWEEYIKEKSPIKIEYILNGNHTKKDIIEQVKSIEFLKYVAERELISPDFEAITNIIHKALKDQPNYNPLEIPSSTMGGIHYGENGDQNLKTYFAFKCQQKTFLGALSSVFIKKTDDLYILKMFYDERKELLSLFWKTFDKGSGSTNLENLSKSARLASSDMQKRFAQCPISFVAIKNGTIFSLNTKAIEQQILPLVGGQDIITIDKKTIGEQEIVKFNLLIKDFIISNLDNKDIVDETGYVALELLREHCFKNEESVKLRNLMGLIDTINKTPSIAEEGYRYGFKTDDDGKIHVRLSNLLILLLELNGKAKQAPFVWLLHILNKTGLRFSILDENWDKEDSPNGILSKYIREYFDCAAYGGFLHYDGKSIVASKTIIFNTGLILKESYSDLFFVISRKTLKDSFSIKGGVDDLDLPDGFLAKEIRPIKFFSHIQDVILETSMVELGKTDYEHILKDRLDRFPKEIQKMYEGRYIDFKNRLKSEIDLALAKCRRDYRFALPQIYFGDIGFLLPIYFEEQEDKSRPAVLLGVTKIKTRGERRGQKYYYKIRTCLTPEMAYANARIIAKPDNNWLKS